MNNNKSLSKHGFLSFSNRLSNFIFKSGSYIYKDIFFIKFLSKFNYIKLILGGIKDNKTEDITIVIGVRNRYDHRLKNAFKSLRNQSYPNSLINIILVDYGSDVNLIPSFKKLCKEYNVRYIRVNAKGEWNRSKALNIGIKQANTKYVLTSDVDIVFEKNYLEVAVDELKKNPFQILYCTFFDLNGDDINANTDILQIYQNLKLNAKYAWKGGKNITLNEGISINMGLKDFYCKIRGYDEFYEGWGGEDRDLIKRFKRLGLKIKNLKDKTSLMHQWHPRFEGIDNAKIIFYKKRGDLYFFKNMSIIRNKQGWGKIPL